MILYQLAGLNLDLAGIWNTAGVVAQFVGGGIVVIIILLIFRYIFKFNKKIILVMKAGDGWTIRDDKGNMNSKKREFVLMKHKHLIVPMPESKHIFLKGGKEVYIGNVINNSVAWITMGDNPLFVPADMNMMNFLVDMYARIDEATKTKMSFWDKYGHQILWGLTMMVFLVVIILILQRMDKILDMGASLGGQIVQAKQSL